MSDAIPKQQSMSPPALEVCAFTIESCRIAERVGAARIELCDNPIEGGTTPSYGVISAARKETTIQLFPIIRPRSMNYCYDRREWRSVLDDVGICRELGCDGVSVGVQKITGEIDAERMREVVEAARPMAVTCNRVFDSVPDPFEALEVLIDAGCVRVLTSGLAESAPKGADILRRLVQQAGARISIMPGAGVRSDNARWLREQTGAHEFHTSARVPATNPMRFTNPRVTDAGNMYIADEQELRSIMQALATA